MVVDEQHSHIVDILALHANCRGSEKSDSVDVMNKLGQEG